MVEYNLVENKYSIEELEDYISNNTLSDDDWYDISIFQKLTEDFIDKYSDRVDWLNIASVQKLSTLFIEKHISKIDIGLIQVYQKLTEPFIDKYNDKVNWDFISSKQKLSEAFIDKYQAVLNWDYIIMYQSLSYEFLEKNLYRYSLYINNIENWMNTSKYYIRVRAKSDICINKKHIAKLRKKYPYKHKIDKLEYELNK